MRIRLFFQVNVLCLAASAAFAQQGRVEGPVAGYVFDSASQALRPVLGIPGASVLGDPLLVGIGLASAAVSPRLDSVIAVATDASFHFFTLKSGVTTEVPVNGIAASPERVVFSPTGSAAALYAGGRIQVLTGMPSAPTLGINFDLALPRGQGSFAGSFAVSDDGSYVLASVGSGAHLFGASGSRQLVSARGASVAFAPGSHDAVIAGSGVTLVKDVGGAADLQVIAPGGAVPATVGVAFSADSRKVFVASAAQQGVTAFDLADGASTAISCDCTPGGITAMGSVYRLNEVGSKPLWLFDTTTTAPRIVFVPMKASL